MNTLIKPGRISNKYRFYVFSFLMSFIMSGAMSISMLLLHSEQPVDALMNWPADWLISLAVAFPVSMVAHRLSGWFSQLIIEA